MGGEATAVSSAVRHRDGAIFSIANVGGELPLAASECLPLRSLRATGVEPIRLDAPTDTPFTGARLLLF